MKTAFVMRSGQILPNIVLLVPAQGSTIPHHIQQHLLMSLAALSCRRVVAARHGHSFPPDGLSGNYGFDPLSLGTDKERLEWCVSVPSANVVRP